MCPFCGSGWYGGFGGLGLLVNLIFLLVLLVGIGLLIWWFVQRSGTDTNLPPAAQSNPALDILNERYAKGEIGTEEYEERRKTLI